MLDMTQIVNYLSSKGISLVRGDNDRTMFYKHSLLNREITIRIDIPPDFPFNLPTFHLCNRLSYGALAHIAWGGNDFAEICYGKESFNINYERPELVLYDAIKKVIDITSKSIKDPNYNDSELKREFVGVWRFHIKSDEKLICICEAPELYTTLNVAQPSNKESTSIRHSTISIAQETMCVNSNNAILKHYFADYRIIKGKGCIIHLDKCPLPPSPNESIIAWWEQILKSQPLHVSEKLREISRLTKSKEFFVVCTFNNCDGRVWVALKFTAEKKQSIPLTPINVNGWQGTAIQLDVMSRTHLLSRAGAKINLDEKNVCIIGCGSLGGMVAEQLVSSGICNITLSDPDSLSIENIYRHCLGSKFVGYNKASGLKQYLETKYPFVKVKASEKLLLEYMDESITDNFDLILVLTGNATHERKFDSWVISSQCKTPIIYGWIEAFGVGGHAIYHNKMHQGCLNCLFIDNVSDEMELYPNINFIAKNQAILKSHAGCGSEFISYSNLDSIQTAMLVTRLALDNLSGKLDKNICHSWRGDGQLAIDNGIKLSHRFFRMTNTEKEIANENCHVCGSR